MVTLKVLTRSGRELVPGGLSVKVWTRHCMHKLRHTPDVRTLLPARRGRLWMT